MRAGAIVRRTRRRQAETTEEEEAEEVAVEDGNEMPLLVLWPHPQARGRMPTAAAAARAVPLPRVAVAPRVVEDEEEEDEGVARRPMKLGAQRAVAAEGTHIAVIVLFASSSASFDLFYP